MRGKRAIVIALLGCLLLSGCSAGPAVPTRAATASLTSTRAASSTPRPTRTARPTATQTHTPSPAVTEGTALVTEIVDGDTIRVKIGDQTYPVRYIGMDTLETNDRDLRIRGLAKAATVANRALVEGKTVRLEKDVRETDQFGRLLRYVYVDDVMVNAELVRLGHAVARQYPPDTRNHALFEQLETGARAAKIGIWAPVQPITLAAASLRAGPDVTYEEVGIIPKSAPIEIVARDAAGDWYQLADSAWILAQYVENAPARAQLVVATAPSRVQIVILDTPTAAPAPPVAPTAAPASPAPRSDAESPVQIVALLRDGDKGQNEPDEYVEITNTGNAPVDLTGWRLVSEVGWDAGQAFAFPRGFILAPQQVCRVYTNEDHPEWCGLSFRYRKSAIWSNNKPDAALLLDASGSLVSTFQ